MKQLFGTFGVRRVANTVLTPEFASEIAAAYGTKVQGTIAVGSDPRTSSEMIKHAVTAGLLSVGCNVVDLGMLPTPALQYAVRNYYDGGIMITASHNPPKYNGLKLLDSDGIGTPDELEEQIEDIYFNKKQERVTWDKIGKAYKRDIIDEYIDEVLKRVDVEAIRDANLKVVLDCGSGAACDTTPYIIRRLGCDLTTLNCQPDGAFPGRNPEPTEENLGDLMAVVKATNADIGFAHDGDADRTICIDENGDFVFGDKSFALVEKAMLEKNNGGKIVTTVATSNAIADIALQNNGEIILTRVGDLVVARKLQEVDGLFGGEENGGLIFPDFVYGRDSGLATAMILEILAKTKKPLSELIDELPTYYSEKMKVECPDDKKQYVADKILEDTTDYEVDTTDGVKIIDGDSWIIIRPSGTEPIYRCFSEATTPEKAQELVEWGIGLINKHLE
ncbi:phosphoglucosamine mutase [Methanosphaera cuniculi]|uniref:Phosphoglucosamine mutase n=1 Tax=Methanosphaera cuniculi TaxID=1077256 RepID=A0A2A2HBC3_9EURY|nr:phosphoglucosamine mutase [Methanosphaera cuniculi]PAV06543.1 phosphoglucosamine mutase [Methanosphaera cuniculi]PWL08494.1 phosphomannomutase/phosphoglucomutase [Methanosphaera cuniculi]